MTCVYNHEDYLNRRLAGEDVISAAAFYGHNALMMNEKARKFIVLELNRNDYSYYEYTVDGGRFFVSDYKDTIQHSIARVITSEMLQNNRMLKWWNCVFYDMDGLRTYDKAYDDLTISDDSDKTFKDIMIGLVSVVSEMHLSFSNHPVFITGEYKGNPLLQYVLQQQRGFSELLVLQSFNDSIPFDEKQVVALPKEKLSKIVLRTNFQIDLTSIIDEPINVTLPLDTTKDSIMLSNIPWRNVLFDENKDYSVQGLDFKTIRLQVGYDSFHDIFMNCQDMRGNRKMIKIN